MTTAPALPLNRRDVLRRLASALAAIVLPCPAWAASPRIVSRAAWGAAPAGPGLIPHVPRDVVIHHTGTRRSTRRAFAVKLRNLQSFAQRTDKLADGRTKRAWPDLPYHFYIDWRGQIAEGRDVRFKGDTNTGYETAGHIQIVLEGNFDVEEPTAEQMTSLAALLQHVSTRWRVPLATLKAHKDLAASACPGRNLASKLPALRRL